MANPSTAAPAVGNAWLLAGSLVLIAFCLVTAVGVVERREV